MSKRPILIKRSPKVISRKIKDQTYILDYVSGEIRILNEVAGFIWKLTKKKIKADEIVKKVRSEYKVDQKTANKDVSEFIDKYLKLGIFIEVKR